MYTKKIYSKGFLKVPRTPSCRSILCRLYNTNPSFCHTSLHHIHVREFVLAFCLQFLFVFADLECKKNVINYQVLSLPFTTFLPFIFFSKFFCRVLCKLCTFISFFSSNFSSFSCTSNARSLH